MKLTIISGGQTGADRGAHDAAIHLGLERGGWAPHGFAAEDGRIPEIYASTMREAVDRGDVGANLKHRTRLNVQDSDATLLFSFTEELTGGTRHTANRCKQLRKNCQVLVLPARGRSRIPDGVRAALLEWLRKHNVEVLNVAGPREGKAPGMQAAVRDALVWILEDEVAENLREGAEVMAAIGALIDSDAPNQFGAGRHGAQGDPATAAVVRAHETAPGSAVPFEYPLSPERKAGLDASIRQAEADIRAAPTAVPVDPEIVVGLAGFIPKET